MKISWIMFPVIERGWRRVVPYHVRHLTTDPLALRGWHILSVPTPTFPFIIHSCALITYDFIYICVLCDVETTFFYQQTSIMLITQQMSKSAVGINTWGSKKVKSVDYGRLLAWTKVSDMNRFVYAPASSQKVGQKVGQKRAKKVFFLRRRHKEIDAAAA